ncbi:MAG TPA: response regulator [Pyrinomonadaceae bacterium]|jgi:CheY-like chemotaxis protein
MQIANSPMVMVADYSEDTREMLRFWLEAEGCCVVEAVNGQEAVELTRGECPDLILMSLRMPVRDGLEATRCIREHVGECNVPIVAMSAYPTQEVQAFALAAGCDSFIAQPIDFSRLGSLLNRLLLGSARTPSPGMIGA